jgi:hypothetical protein
MFNQSNSEKLAHLNAIKVSLSISIANETSNTKLVRLRSTLAGIDRAISRLLSPEPEPQPKPQSQPKAKRKYPSIDLSKLKAFLEETDIDVDTSHTSSQTRPSITPLLHQSKFQWDEETQRYIPLSDRLSTSSMPHYCLPHSQFKPSTRR